MQVLLQFLLLSCAQKYRERSQHHVRDNQWERERETWTAHGNTSNWFHWFFNWRCQEMTKHQKTGRWKSWMWIPWMPSLELLGGSCQTLGCNVVPSRDRSHGTACGCNDVFRVWGKLAFLYKRFCNACVSCMCIKIVHWPARRLRWAKTELVSMLILLHLVASCCARIIQLLLAIGWLCATAVFRKYLHLLQLETNWG